jgi:glycosyltransferase involved in cell wall biosynthesis
MTTGVVVIGRNEGERLRRCLASVVGQAEAVVYVDSGSTDGSVMLAKSCGVAVVELDMSIPFSAARARNSGFDLLVSRWPDIRWVQFVDGDCELNARWLAIARDALAARDELAIVAGRLMERAPEVSIYNRLGELEWNFLGSGDVDAVGGIFMIRRHVFEASGGFNPTVYAGEEPELCLRLMQAGWAISRLDVEMAWHDLAMTRFGQWWKRQIRSGYGALDVVTRFGLPQFGKQVWRARLWSAWPLFGLLAGLGIGAFAGGQAGWLAALAMLGLWPLQMLRIAVRTWRQGHPLGTALPYAFFTMIGFWPQMVGQLQYLHDRLRNHGARLIEYKQAATFPSHRHADQGATDGHA